MESKRKINRILLIDPPVTRPMDFSARVARVGIVVPLGLAYIAAVLERNGIEVRVLDCVVEGIGKGERPYQEQLRYGLSDEEVQHEIEDYKPDIVGVSCLFSNKIWDAHNMCRLAKEISPEIITVMGGAHPSAVPEMELQDKNLDFIIVGEGESTFLDLIRAIEGDKTFSELDGLAHRDTIGLIHVLPKTRYIDSLDMLPFPARHLLRMDEYLQTTSGHSGFKRTPFTQMITSRACPARCTFCAIGRHWGRKHRARSPENVLNEIELLIRDYGIREIHFEDDNLTLNKKRAMRIFEGMIERGFGITWSTPSGTAIWALDEELLETMAASGCHSISLPVESGDPEVLRNLIRKPVRLERVKPLVQKARELRMKVKGFFILGYPGETKETMCRTVDFARSLELDWTLFFMASPLVGTEMYEICRQNGYFKYGEADFVRSFYRGVIETPEFTAEYVEQFREEANIDLNFRGNPNLWKYDVDEAIADFKSVLSFYPHLPYAHFSLGKAYERKGLIGEAKEEWKRTLELDSAHSEAHRCLEATRL